jgi:uncharacterized membrane protein
MNVSLIYYVTALIILLALIGFIALLFFCRSNTGDFGSFTSSGSGSSSQGCFHALIVIVIIFALIGLFVGIVFSGVTLGKIMKHHASKLWLRPEATKYIAKDFQGQRAELEKYNLTLSAFSMP